MNVVLTQLAKTNILVCLNKTQSKKYVMADIKEITIWGQVIQIETRDEKMHHISLKIG